MQQDLKAGRHDRMVFYVFDLMHLDGRDLKPLALSARKAALARLVAKSRQGWPAALEPIAHRAGRVLLKHACKMGLEGIVSKRADAPYRSGRGHDWIKTKCSDRQELVVAGFVPSTADAHAIGALVLGYYEGGKLRYAGRTGTGFSHASARELYRKLKAIEAAKAAFDTGAQGRARRAQADLGRAEAGRRSRFSRLDAWRARTAGLVPGPARGQAGQSKSCARSRPWQRRPRQRPSAARLRAMPRPWSAA